AVVAPSVEAAVRDILGRKRGMRVVIADCSSSGDRALELRSILGAILAQERDLVSEAEQPWTRSLPEGMQGVSRRAPTAGEWESLRFAWRVCAHVKSNAVVFSNRQQTLGIGAGQMSRVDAVRVAVMTARASEQRLAGSAAATDGFFPFRDGVDEV